jgi:hypothetical protein
MPKRRVSVVSALALAALSGMLVERTVEKEGVEWEKRGRKGDEERGARGGGA